MRSVCACIAGLVVFLAVAGALTVLGQSLGVTSSVEFDEPFYVGGSRFADEEEVSSSPTSYGIARAAFALVVALWVGQAVYHGEFGAGFSPRGWYSFAAWLVATAILMVLSILITLAFKDVHGKLAYYARLLLEMSAVAGVAWASHQWFINRAKALDARKKLREID